MTLKPSHRGGPAVEKEKGNSSNWLAWLFWGIAIAMVALAVFVMVRKPAFAASVASAGSEPENPFLTNQQDIPSIPAPCGG